MSVRRDVLADPTTGDLSIVGGVVQWVSDGAAIQQSLTMRLRLFLGEWFADEAAGLPYFQTIFVKNPNVARNRAAFRSCILGTPGVNSLLDFSTAFDRRARTYSVSCRVDTDLGALTATATVTTP